MTRPNVQDFLFGCSYDVKYAEGFNTFWPENHDVTYESFETFKFAVETILVEFGWSMDQDCVVTRDDRDDSTIFYVMPDDEQLREWYLDGKYEDVHVLYQVDAECGQLGDTYLFSEDGDELLNYRETLIKHALEDAEKFGIDVADIAQYKLEVVRYMRNKDSDFYSQLLEWSQEQILTSC